MFDWYADIKEAFPLVETILIGLAVIVVTWLVERAVFKFIRRIGQSDQNVLPASSIFANIARVAIWLGGAAIFLKMCFGYDITAFIAALGVGGIAISLGLQDTLSNLIGGLQVSLGKLVEPGDVVEVLNQRGEVLDVSWRHTTIRDINGNVHLVPNSLMNKNSIVKDNGINVLSIPFLIPEGIDPLTAQRDLIPRLARALSAYTQGEVEVLFDETVVGGTRALVSCSVFAERITAAVASDKALHEILAYFQSVESASDSTASE